MNAPQPANFIACDCVSRLNTQLYQHLPLLIALLIDNSHCQIWAVCFGICMGLWYACNVCWSSSRWATVDGCVCVCLLLVSFDRILIFKIKLYSNHTKPKTKKILLLSSVITNDGLTNHSFYYTLECFLCINSVMPLLSSSSYTISSFHRST